MTNLFGSMVIFLDKPFQIGDWIEMGKIEVIFQEVMSMQLCLANEDY